MADRYRGEDGVGNSTEVSSSSSGNLQVDLEGDARTRPVLSATEFSGHKKKATSFQITSVTVQGNRLSNDGGDDSADDLDESHTEDISSDILDCSKTTEVDNDPISSDNSNSNVEELSSASKPSIPVSTIGFSVPLSIGVSSDFTDETSSQITGMNNTVNVPTANAQEPLVTSLPDHWQHRFKIVKLANSEPFKRGRWLCMDFTDPPVIHNEHKPEFTDMHVPVGQEATSTPFSVNVISNENVGLPADRPNSVAQVYEIAINQSCPGGISVAVGPQQQTTQPIYGFIVPVSSAALPSVTMVQTIAMQTATETSKGGLVYNGQVLQPQAVLAQPQTVQSQPTQIAIPVPIHSTVSHHNQPPVVPPPTSTTQSVPQVSLSVPVPVSQQQPPILISQPAVGLPTSVPALVNNPLPAVSVPDPNAGRKPEVSALPSHLPTVPSVSNAVDSAAIGLRISSLVNPAPLLEVIPDTLGTKSAQEGEDSESAPAGSNTVAIDNKIEQAMDLVKSHLMFAVREEVDVLKERITELVDYITRLEQENSILKANASTETLSLLGQLTAAPAPVQMGQQQPQLVSSQHSVSTQQTQTTAST